VLKYPWSSFASKKGLAENLSSPLKTAEQSLTKSPEAVSETPIEFADGQRKVLKVSELVAESVCEAPAPHRQEIWPTV